jgi:hypothetical protein
MISESSLRISALAWSTSPGDLQRLRRIGRNPGRLGSVRNITGKKLYLKLTYDVSF